MIATIALALVMPPLLGLIAQHHDMPHGHFDHLWHAAHGEMPDHSTLGLMDEGPDADTGAHQCCHGHTAVMALGEWVELAVAPRAHPSGDGPGSSHHDRTDPPLPRPPRAAV